MHRPRYCCRCNTSMSPSVVHEGPADLRLPDVHEASTTPVPPRELTRRSKVRRRSGLIVPAAVCERTSSNREMRGDKAEREKCGETTRGAFHGFGRENSPLRKRTKIGKFSPFAGGSAAGSSSLARKLRSFEIREETQLDWYPVWDVSGRENARNYGDEYAAPVSADREAALDGETETACTQSRRWSFFFGSICKPSTQPW